MRVICACLACLLFSSLSWGADEWPEYRGRDGQGHSDAKGLPTAWSDSQNVVWKATVPGKGWSSPVVSGEEVWVTTAVEADKPDAGTPPSTESYFPAKPSPGTIVSPKPLSMRAICFDLKTGNITKNVEAFFIEKPGNIHRRNSYASPSPIIENGKLYVHFGTYGTACISTADSKVLWRNKELQINHENGPGSTPVLFKDKLLICFDGSDQQFMAALKKDTGEVAWKTPRSTVITKGPDQRKAYGTPLATTIDGKDQVIAPAADSLYSYDIETGKELWKVKYTGYSNVARPIYDGKLIYFSTGFDTPEVWAIKPGGSGELGPDSVVWKQKVQAARQASPLISGTRLYMFSDGGVVRCLEAATAKELWREKVGSDGAASPIVADGKVYFFDAMEGATVVEDSDTLKILSKNKLDEGFMASPAVVGKALVVRTKLSLYRLEQK